MGAGVGEAEVSETQLVKYETARRALAEAKRVDEVKQIHDKAEAIRVYARQADDGEMIRWATDIRERAKVRGGEILIAMAERGERDTGRGGDRRAHCRDGRVKIPELGITHKQSSQWQKLANLPKKEQEQAIERAKDIATGAVARAPRKPRSAPPEPREQIHELQDDCPDCATPAEARRLGFLNVAAGVVAYASRHDLSADPVDREMVEAAEAAATAWTNLAADLRRRL
jgi:hypothetical protein